MEKAPQAIISEVSRDFIENVLNFGAPVPIALLNTNKEAIHYGSTNNHSKASINAVTLTQWEKQHLLEEHKVFHDVFNPTSNALIVGYIEKELAKKGYFTHNVIRPQQLERFVNLTQAIQLYASNMYPASRANMVSSVTLKPAEDIVSYDLLLRVLFMTEQENMYLEFNFPNCLGKLEVLIHPSQIYTVGEIIKNYIASFGDATSLFKDIKNVELSKMMAHLLVNNRQMPPEGVYSFYGSLVANHLSKSSEDALIASKLLFWNDLKQTERSIFAAAVEIATSLISSYVVFNMQQAQEQ